MNKFICVHFYGLLFSVPKYVLFLDQEHFLLRFSAQVYDSFEMYFWYIL